MFGLSFGEILLILVVALLVLGPERLPKVARTVGKGMRELRRATGDFREVVESEFYVDDADKGPALKSAAPVIRPAASALPAAAAESAAAVEASSATADTTEREGASAAPAKEGAPAPLLADAEEAPAEPASTTGLPPKEAPG